ncbi:hypothetical protein GCM10010406_17830 [Streptomyces thermolineatus]|uniref:Secreted protein n=1 Tax=Streptomyces thermolineatus TaxID=44033 RepID=A0ABP5YPU0_9ACTN
MQQPSAGVLPHTRTRAVHWISTAAALGAVVGGGMLVQPAGASPSGPDTAIGARSGGEAVATTAPDPDEAEYPFDCAGVPVLVVDHAPADLDGDGRPETVALVRCDAPGGNPPNGVYLLSAGTGANAAPQVAEAFVEPEEGLVVDGLEVTGREVSATLRGYSDDSVPRCCPDQERRVSWRWKDGSFLKYAAPPPGAV